MQKRIRMLLTVLLASAVILSMMFSAVAEEHEHEWEVNEISGDTHIITCKTCGRYTMDSHTYDSSGFCIFCGYEKHEHDYQCKSYDHRFHTMVCITCGYERTTTHSFKNTDTCTVCGYTEHEHTWQYNGETYANCHYMKCTQCDTLTSEDHTYGSDEKFIVCGALPPHWHEFHWKGKQYSERYHLLECDCGVTSVEEHMLVWDEKNRTEFTHGVICIVCGETRTHGHWYSNIYQNGETCVECGYERVIHTWQYDGYYDEDGHEMFCSDCGSYKMEDHNPGSNGNCVVCDYHVHDAKPVETKPAETEPAETKPAETKPAETKPAETKPAVTEPTETEPAETNPAVTEPAETEPEETKPAVTDSAETERTEVKPAASEPLPENDVDEEPQNSSTAWIWVAAVVVICGVGTAVLIWKKKSTKPAQ